MKRKPWPPIASLAGPFSWTQEKFGYLLRDGKGGPYAAVTKGNDGMYTASLLTPGFPGNGPFKQQTKAGEQAEKMLCRAFDIDDDAEFGRMPYQRGKLTRKML